MSLNDSLSFSHAISPKDIDALRKEYLLKKAHQIPKEIIKVFNDMIVENYSGGTAVLTQAEVLERVVCAVKIPRADVFKNGWLDVEPVFKEAGWKVSYDQPAYNESYDASWIFKKE
jgi:hypothetical protein